MESMVLPVNAIEKIQAQEIKVYGVEKGKGDQNSYQQAARAAALRRAVQSEEIPDFTETVSRELNRGQFRSFGQISPQAMDNSLLSMEMRQKQIEFQKSIQGSRARSVQALAAYEASFV